MKKHEEGGRLKTTAQSKNTFQAVKTAPHNIPISTKTMNIDKVYHRIGGFGTFQKKAFALYLIGSVYYGTQIVINIFAGVLPTNQTCADPPGLDACDVNCTKLQFNDYDGYHSYSIEVSVIKCC